jgi:hypothetical protein
LKNEELLKTLQDILTECEGGWQSLEVRAKNAAHNAERVLKALIDAGHFKG